METLDEGSKHCRMCCASRLLLVDKSPSFMSQLSGSRRPSDDCKMEAPKALLAEERWPRPSAWRSMAGSGPVLMLPLGLVVINLLFSATLATSLKVSVSIPELVKLNDAFWLNCSYNQADRLHHNHHQQLTSSPNQAQENARQDTPDSGDQSERIYSIKWYKDEEEFYRYLPSAEPKVSIYETNGITLDQTKSHEGNVYLAKADVNTEGIYRCEVLSEAPLFETVRKSKHLRVYALPVRGPRIEILDSNGRIKNPKAQEITYEVGDKIELRCNSAPSKPAARLRWYLNDRELVIRAGAQQSINTTADRPLSRVAGANLGFQPASLLNGPTLADHTVKVTPVEYRQHYKGIYSSHSALSLVLQRDDFANSRMSFKCLASMRQEVPIASKQLIVLTPQQSREQLARLRARSPELVQAKTDHLAARHRAQYERRPKLGASSSSEALELMESLQEEARHQQSSQLMYIYEESDSTLGPSIIDAPDKLHRYLTSRSGSNDTGPHEHANQQPAEFNRADNLEYVQLMRDRYARQRSFPQTTSSSNSINFHKRLYGPNWLVKSPLYLDEFDPFRPVISWPPLESGRLMLLPPSNSIVAVPTTDASRRSGHETRFVMPPESLAEQQGAFRAGNSRQMNLVQLSNIDSANANLQIILNKLVENLNCTSTETSIDTKLSWSINELPLGSRDTRHYPTRISPDHKQTWVTIGLQPTMPVTSAGTQASGLVSILSQYYRTFDAFKSDRPQAGNSRLFVGASSGQPAQSSSSTPPAASSANEHLKLMCQATHSMLLYSSSEMITFDFNPPATNQLEANSMDKFSSMPSNVITAATASPTRSGSSPSLINKFSHGSHHKLALVVLTLATEAALLSFSISYTRTIVLN